MIRSLLIAFALPLVTLALPVRAWGAETAEAELGQARALHASGNFAECIDILEHIEGYESKPRVLWNLAACEQKLGRYDSAVAHVERYLALSGTALSEAEAQRARRFLEAARPLTATGRAATAAPSQAAPPEIAPPDVPPPASPAATNAPSPSAPPLALRGGEPAPPEHPSRLPSLLAGGAGVAAAIAGLVLVFDAASTATELASDCAPSCPPSRWESSRTEETVGVVLVATGAGLVTLAAALWIFGGKGAPRSAARPLEVRF